MYNLKTFIVQGMDYRKLGYALICDPLPGQPISVVPILEPELLLISLL